MLYGQFARYVICLLFMCGMKFACFYGATAEYCLELIINLCNSFVLNCVIPLWRNERLFGQPVRLEACLLMPLVMPVELKGKLFCGFYNEYCIEFVSAYCSP